MKSLILKLTKRSELRAASFKVMFSIFLSIVLLLVSSCRDPSNSEKSVTEIKTETTSQQENELEWKDAFSTSGIRILKVNQKNETEGEICGLKRFNALTRAGATCIVQMFNQSNKTSTGMVGLVTYASENEDGTMNFLVSGVTNDHGTIKTYASFFCNVDKEKLSTKNFGVSATKDAFDANTTTPYEVEILKWPTTLSRASLESDGTLRVAIDFKGNKDGTIDIAWYSVPQMPSVGDQAAASFDPAANGALKLAAKTATAKQLGTTEGMKKGYIYYYANIYTGQTLNAQWDLYNATTWSQAAYADEETCNLPEVPEISSSINKII